MNRIAEIHALKAKAGLSEQHYRDLLSGWEVSSAKELTPRQAQEVVEALRGLAGQPAKRSAWKSEPYRSLDGRGADWPSNKQLWMLIDCLWMRVTRMRSRVEALDALETWLDRQFGIKRIEWILREDVGKIKRALEAMVAQENAKKG